MSVLVHDAVCLMKQGEEEAGEEGGAAHSIHVCAVCEAPAEHRCSACKCVAYCTREHQKKDWKAHKLVCKPPPFEVNTTIIFEF